MKQTKELFEYAKNERKMWNEITFGEGQDIIDSWRFWVEKAPSIVRDWSGAGLTRSIEESTLDNKTRELIMLALLAYARCSWGVLAHVMIALNNGATEDEIVDVMHLVAYESAKIPISEAGPKIEEAFARYHRAKAKKK
jgi:AhpD family alkylhydroperoxidase